MCPHLTYYSLRTQSKCKVRNQCEMVFLSLRVNVMMQDLAHIRTTESPGVIPVLVVGHLGTEEVEVEQWSSLRYKT